ncbi:iron-sulfur cluster co-chaperone protein HscB-like protein, mitochondrial [Xylocopa sonorina]|uniref:iron-sulfur cluster co-chaperone protein HscB-like protein, mitochondrial n=1 Tax=Xylocopa sonorina TaxID=1818115 RepID=UPI00403A9785
MYLRRVLFNLRKKYNISCLVLVQQQQYVYFHNVERNYNPSQILTNALQYSNDSALKCWNCNFMYKSDLFCSKCKVLQEPPENVTYFDLMGIPASYDVKVAEIQNKYKELQKQLHPDKFGAKSNKEKELSEILSSLVNKAYSTLSNPLKRGLYMLELNNITISEETDNVNAEFLMEIMEKNEEVDDAADDEEKIKKLAEENRAVLNDLIRKVADAFRQNDIKEAEFLLIRMKYYDTINNRLKKLKHDLGIVE